MVLRAMITLYGSFNQWTAKCCFLCCQFEGLGPEGTLVGNVPLELRHRLVSLCCRSFLGWGYPAQTFRIYAFSFYLPTVWWVSPQSIHYLPLYSSASSSTTWAMVKPLVLGSDPVLVPLLPAELCSHDPSTHPASAHRDGPQRKPSGPRILQEICTEERLHTRKHHCAWAERWAGDIRIHTLVHWKDLASL